MKIFAHLQAKTKVAVLDRRSYSKSNSALSFYAEDLQIDEQVLIWKINKENWPITWLGITIYKEVFFKEIKITRLSSKVTKLTKQGMAKKKEEKNSGWLWAFKMSIII